VLCAVSGHLKQAENMSEGVQNGIEALRGNNLKKQAINLSPAVY
jgi:hypothetical protein